MVKIIEAFPGLGGLNKLKLSPEPEQNHIEKALQNHKRLGLKPDFLFGHSYGLYGAIIIAGVVTAVVAKKLARERAMMVEISEEGRKNNPTGMLSIVGPDIAQIIQILEKIKEENSGTSLYITNYNGPGAHVVSGDQSELDKVRAILSKIPDYSVTDVGVIGSYHHPYREGERKAYRQILEEVEWKEPEIPIISSTGEPWILRTVKDIIRELAQQMSRPVNLPRAFIVARQAGAEVVVDIGPGKMIERLGDRLGIDGLRFLSFERDEKIILKLGEQQRKEADALETSQEALGMVK